MDGRDGAINPECTSSQKQALALGARMPLRLQTKIIERSGLIPDTAPGGRSPIELKAND